MLPLAAPDRQLARWRYQPNPKQIRLPSNMSPKGHGPTARQSSPWSDISSASLSCLIQAIPKPSFFSMSTARSGELPARAMAKATSGLSLATVCMVVKKRQVVVCFFTAAGQKCNNQLIRWKPQTLARWEDSIHHGLPTYLAGAPLA